MPDALLSSSRQPTLTLPLFTPRSPAAQGRPVRRWFYVAGALVAILLSVAAFTPSILSSAGRRGPLTPLVAAHAVLMLTWLGLFLAQSLLAATGRLRAHRRLGPAAVVVAAGVVVTGYFATVAMARRGFDLSGDLSRNGSSALDQTVFQFGSLVIFSLLVTTALLLRRRPEAHKRLMMLAVLQTLMAAPLAHLVGHFGLPGLILPAWGVAVAIVLVSYDRVTRERIHPVSLLGGVGLVIVNNVQAVVIGPSAAWRQFVSWLAS